LFDPLLSTLARVEETRGSPGLVTYVKGLRSSLFAYLANNKDAKIEGIGLTKDRIPKVFGPLIPYIRETWSAKLILPFLITVLYSTRSLQTGGKGDLSSIISCSAYSYDMKSDPYAF
jgi:hypothetical protein